MAAVGRCGAPIYAPSPWHSILPPPSQYSCLCFEGTGHRIATATTTHFTFPELTVVVESPEVSK